MREQQTLPGFHSSDKIRVEPTLSKLKVRLLVKFHFDLSFGDVQDAAKLVSALTANYRPFLQQLVDQVQQLRGKEHG